MTSSVTWSRRKRLCASGEILRAGQDLRPRGVRIGAGRQPDPARGVAEEVGGVEVDVVELGRAGEGDHDVVVAGGAAAGGLPALGHRPGDPGVEQQPRVGVEHVADLGDVAAVVQRGQIDAGTEQPRVGHGGAVHPQPGDTAVGEDVQPDVGEGVVIVHAVGVLGVPAGGRARHDGDPVRRLQGVLVRTAVDPGRLDGDLRRVVAGEPRGVHDDLVDRAGRAELHDGPVVAGVAASAGLPAVVDLAVGTEGGGVVHGRGGEDQRLARARRTRR